MNLAGSLVLKTIVHESGHALAAKSLGFDVFMFRLTHGGFSGVTGYYTGDPNGPTLLEESYVTASGVLATSILGEGIRGLSYYGGETLRPFLSTFAVVLMLDRHVYIWKSGVYHLLGKNSVNDDVHNLIADNLPNHQTEAHLVLMGLSAVEIALRWDTYRGLIYGSVGKVENSVEINLTPTGFSVSGTW